MKTYYFARFRRKLYENERNWTGGHMSLGTPFGPPMGSKIERGLRTISIVKVFLGGKWLVSPLLGWVPPVRMKSWDCRTDECRS